MKTSPLPNPGPNRWWKVELASKRAQNPIRVSLMENLVADDNGTARRPSMAIAERLTVANADAIKEAGQKILAAVGDYKNFVGEYYIEPRGGAK